MIPAVALDLFDHLRRQAEYEDVVLAQRDVEEAARGDAGRIVVVVLRAGSRDLEQS